ncbi:MAG: L,D-transpeptidase family protein, partial [Bilophila wadsworthia]
IFMPFECVSMRVWGCTALLLAGLMCVPEARAWEAVTDGLPDQAVVAVDKSRQRFFLMEKGKARDYLCTTGQAQGDKQVRGDLKTPEGVYFVVRKRTEQLDFEEYGGEAYILDYPNPVDRLRGKTGSGIWVHSRGRAITPFESRGCVVLNLKDIAEVGPELKRGHPCLSANGGNRARKDAVHEVEERTRGWRAAWRRGEAGDGSLRRNVPHP